MLVPAVGGPINQTPRRSQDSEASNARSREFVSIAVSWTTRPLIDPGLKIQYRNWLVNWAAVQLHNALFGVVDLSSVPKKPYCLTKYRAEQLWTGLSSARGQCMSEVRREGIAGHVEALDATTLQQNPLSH